MTIQRCPHDRQNPYAQINRKIFTDPDLSWEAKGLLAYFISLPDDWKIKVPHLVTLYDKRGGGEKAIYRIINELIEAGYCTRIRISHENGHFGETIYNISEFKKSLPHSREGDAENARAEKGDYNKEEVLQRNKNNKQDPVVVPSFIQEIEDLTDEEKNSLSKHPPDRVKLALEFNKKVKPTHSKIQQLIWHCKSYIPPKPSKKSEQDNLYEYCVDFFKSNISKTCEVKIHKEGIFFIPTQGANTNPIEIKFNQENCAESIKNLCNHYNFTKKKM